MQEVTFDESAYDLRDGNCRVPEYSQCRTENTGISLQRRNTTMQQHILTGRITRLAIFTLSEFGTRASFILERPKACPVSCSVSGNVAREFVAHYFEGDMVAVTGIHESRPSTAAANTPWSGRFRVGAMRVAEDALFPA